MEVVRLTRWDWVRRGGGFHPSSSELGRIREAEPGGAGAKETPGAPWIESPMSAALEGRGGGMREEGEARGRRRR